MYSASNTNEKNDTNQKQFNNAIQIILNICYYPDSGKLILSDNFNHHYSCDLFGRIQKKFLPNVTGQVSYQERKIKTEEKYRMSKTTNNFSIGEKENNLKKEYKEVTKNLENSKFYYKNRK